MNVAPPPHHLSRHTCVGTGGEGDPAVGPSPPTTLETAAGLADLADPWSFERWTGLKDMLPEEDAVTLLRYHRLRVFAYEKEGIRLELPRGLVSICGKFTGGEQITLMILLPYLQGAITQRQVRAHLKAEVGRRNRWYRRGGNREIGDAFATRWTRRMEILQFHREYARHHGWDFTEVTCSPERLVDELVTRAIAGWDDPAQFIGFRGFPGQMLELAKAQGQFIDLRRGSPIRRQLYTLYIERLSCRLEQLGLSLAPLALTLGMMGNTRRKDGDAAARKVTPATGTIVPASGSGRMKGDAVVGRFMVEVKLVRANRCRLVGSQLGELERNARRARKIPVFVFVFPRPASEDLIAIFRRDGGDSTLPDALVERAMAGQRSLRQNVAKWVAFGQGGGRRIRLAVDGRSSMYHVVALRNLEETTLERVVESGQ